MFWNLSTRPSLTVFVIYLVSYFEQRSPEGSSVEDPQEVRERLRQASQELYQGLLLLRKNFSVISMEILAHVLHEHDKV